MVFLASVLLATNAAGAYIYTLDTSAWNGISSIIEIDLVDGAPSPARLSFSAPVVDGVIQGSGGTLEDNLFFNAFEYPLVLGNSLSITFIIELGSAPQAGFLPDSASLFLLDTNLFPLFATSDPTQADSLLQWDIGLGEPVAFVGALAADDDEDNNGVPEPGTLLLLACALVLMLRARLKRALVLFVSAGLTLASVGASAQAIGDGSDLTASVNIAMSGLRLNRSTGTFDAVATVTNTSADTISGPGTLAVYDLPGGVILTNATAIADEGVPFITDAVTAELPSGQSARFILKFLNRTNQRFPASLRFVRLVQPVPGVNQLMGPDLDGNGVRDDLDPMIDLRYRDDAEAKGAATQVLGSMRRGLASTGSVQSAFDATVVIHRAYDCLESVMGTDQSEQEAFYLRDLMMNSKARVQAWIGLSDLLAGQSIRIGSPNPCD